jgi:septal ring factor EnvC (AmiA/AmiB activator)
VENNGQKLRREVKRNEIAHEEDKHRVAKAQAQLEEAQRPVERSDQTAKGRLDMSQSLQEENDELKGARSSSAREFTYLKHRLADSQRELRECENYWERGFRKFGRSKRARRSRIA